MLKIKDLKYLKNKCLIKGEKYYYVYKITYGVSIVHIVQLIAVCHAM
jgi:hypothetical protein